MLCAYIATPSDRNLLIYMRVVRSWNKVRYLLSEAREWPHTCRWVSSSQRYIKLVIHRKSHMPGFSFFCYIWWLLCTGCPNNLHYKSKYYKLRKPLAVVPEANDVNGSTSSVVEDEIGLIIGKKKWQETQQVWMQNDFGAELITD